MPLLSHDIQDKNFTTAFSSLHYHFFNSQAGETRNSSAMVESIEKEKIYAMIKLRRTQLMRKVIKVSLVSTAIIFFLSNSSWIPSFLNSTTPQLFFLWHTNRAVMFIICNAILLFLIKDSGLLRIHQSSDDCLYDILIKEETHDERFEEGDMEAFVVLDDDEGELADGEWESDDEGESVGCLDIVAVAEEEEIDEELNKVFDEFIERFKRERRLEAMQLVVV